MPIEKVVEEERTTWTLSDANVEVEIELFDYEPVEMQLWTEDVNLVSMAEEEAEGWNPSKKEFVEAIEDGLDLVLDSVEIDAAAPYEASFTLRADSIVLAGERWGGPKELFPG